MRITKQKERLFFCIYYTLYRVEIIVDMHKFYAFVFSLQVDSSIYVVQSGLLVVYIVEKVKQTLISREVIIKVHLLWIYCLRFAPFFCKSSHPILICSLLGS